MPHRIETAKLAAISVAGGSANLIAVTTAATGLTQQLNQTHQFLYLDLPIWIFFAGAFVLSIIGSVISLYIDVMNQTPMTRSQLVINLTMGFLIGVLGAFVVLPALAAEPPMPIILLTALFMSVLGTVLIRNIGEILRSAELWQAVKDIVMSALAAVKEVAIERMDLFIQLIFGGRKK